MGNIAILSIQRIGAADRARVEAVDPAIHLTDAGGWFDGEIRDTWPPYAAARYLPPGTSGLGTRDERDRLLAEAEIILGGWPLPARPPARPVAAIEMVSPGAPLARQQSSPSGDPVGAKATSRC